MFDCLLYDYCKLCHYVCLLVVLMPHSNIPGVKQLIRPDTSICFPGILGSARTCLHSVLAFLGQGVGARSGPVCLMEAPRLAELGYNLIYVLCSNKDTSAPTLRYLRTTHNFLYNQLQHLPFREEEYGAWILSGFISIFANNLIPKLQQITHSTACVFYCSLCAIIRILLCRLRLNCQL